MPQKVTNHVNALGKTEGLPKLLTFYDRKGQTIGDHTYECNTKGTEEDNDNDELTINDEYPEEYNNDDLADNESSEEINPKGMQQVEQSPPDNDQTDVNHTLVTQCLMTQMSMKAGLKRFGKERTDAVSRELSQLYLRDTSEPIDKEDVHSPTMYFESVMLAAAIDAEEHCDDAIADIPKAFVQTKLEDEADMVMIHLRGHFG